MKKYLISIILIFSLVFTACSNLIDSSENSEKEEIKDGMAKVFISINNSFQRTAFPQDLILENCTDLVLTGATSTESNKVLGKWDTISEINNQAIYLPAATYTTLTLSARINGYKLQDSKNNVRLYTAYDYDSNTISLNFNLTITSVEYKGESTFDFELIYPIANEYKAVTASILDTEGNLVEGFNQIELSESEYDVNRKHVFFSNTGIKKLPAGQYLVKFYLYTDSKKQNLANVYQEIFHLQNEVPTTGVFEISAKADVYSIEYVLQEDEKWADSYEPPLSYQPFKGQLLPSGENITKEGYQLAGWKEVGQTDDNYFTSIQSWSKGNKIICPVWTSGSVVKSELEFEELLKSYNEAADYGPHEIIISQKKPDMAVIVATMKKYPNVKVSLDLSQALSIHEIPYESSFVGVTNLTGIILPRMMTKICSFKNCKALEKIVLYNSFTSVDRWIFEGCNKINKVYYNGTLDDWLNITFGDEQANPCWNGADLYINNELLTDLVIPEGIEIIHAGAFHGCTSITSVSLPSTLKQVDEMAFYNCTNITKTSFSGNLFQWCSIVFSNDFYHIVDSNPCFYSKNLFIEGEEVKGAIVIPEGIVKLYSTFCNLEGITEVTFPSTLKNIYDGTFYNCGLQGRLNLPDGLITVGEMAFAGCSGLGGELIIPDTVESIDSRAFANCNFSGKVIIPDSVKEARQGIFYNNNLITDIVLGSGLQYYIDFFDDYNKTVNSITFGSNIISIGKNSSYAVYNNIYFNGELSDWLNIKFSTYSRSIIGTKTSLYFNNKLLKEIVVPEGVKVINNYQFMSLSQITSVKMSSTVEEIGDSAFAYCENLSSITLNEGLKYIGPQAFSSCKKVKSLTIPSTVEHINYWAFNYCEGLTSVTFKDTKNWYQKAANGYSSGSVNRIYEGGTAISVTNATTNAKTFKEFVGFFYKLVN